MHISEKDGRMSFVNLGSIRDFVRDMPNADTEKNMKKKVDFLCDFEVTQSYGIIPRRKPLSVVKDNFRIDDGVFETVGIFRHSSSRCASAFAYYATLLKEYMNVFKPDSIVIGGVRFSMHNFYYELLQIVQEAGAFITEDDTSRNEKVRLLHMVKILFATGVFEYYESRCETTKLDVLKEAFVEREDLDIKTYFLFKEIKHEIFINGRVRTVTDYITSLIQDRDAEFICGILKDKIVRAYLDANDGKRKMRSNQEEIEKLIKSCSTMVDSF